MGFGLGVAALATSKILENMEVGHNVMHGQYDWTRDPALDARTYEWDTACTGDDWRHSHNYEHHTFTNVLGRDRDVGYGFLRVSEAEDGDWSDTVAADVTGNLLYTIERDGTLYVTDLDNFDEDSEELDTGYDTKAMWIYDDYVYVLENDGTLYKVHGESGESERVGAEGAYSDTLAATVHDGHFYAVEDDGAIGVTSLEDGGYTEHTGGTTSAT